LKEKKDKHNHKIPYHQSCQIAKLYIWWAPSVFTTLWHYYKYLPKANATWGFPTKGLITIMQLKQIKTQGHIGLGAGLD
jgi:hypothetical protein